MEISPWKIKIEINLRGVFIPMSASAGQVEEEGAALGALGGEGGEDGLSASLGQRGSRGGGLEGGRGVVAGHEGRGSKGVRCMENIPVACGR